jgi:hypothetical protein
MNALFGKPRSGEILIVWGVSPMVRIDLIIDKPRSGDRQSNAIAWGSRPRQNLSPLQGWMMGCWVFLGLTPQAMNLSLLRSFLFDRDGDFDSGSDWGALLVACVEN